MRDQQQRRNEAAPGNEAGSASDRAAEQIDRHVEHEHDVEALVRDVGDQDERRDDGRREESSRAQLRAMTPPQHDAEQIDQMTGASARVRPRPPSRPRRPWWRRLFA